MIYRVNKLYETMHHNDFKGQTEFYVGIVVDNIKAETNEVLAHHADIMERIKRDHENTPQGRSCFLCLFTRVFLLVYFFSHDNKIFYVWLAQAQKALQDEIRDLEERLDKNKVDIQKNKDAMNGFEEKAKDFLKTVVDECAETEAQINAMDQSEDQVSFDWKWKGCNCFFYLSINNCMNFSIKW